MELIATSKGERRRRSVTESLDRRAKAAASALQKRIGTRPKHFALISGAPRSGTTAVGAWLCDCRGVAGFMESRILVAVHRFIEQVRRFEDLQCMQDDLMELARDLVYAYYADRVVFFRKTLLLDKEPLEPIAFPDKRYKAFVDNVRGMLPEAKLLFMMRDPVSAVASMRQRRWGYSLTNARPREFSLAEHVDAWCASTDCVLQYANDPNTYICQFNRLVSEPELESKRICDFLEIPISIPFRPHPTHPVELSDREVEFILSESKERIEALRERGIM